MVTMSGRSDRDTSGEWEERGRGKTGGRERQERVRLTVRTREKSVKQSSG